MSLASAEATPSADDALSLQFDESDADLLARAFRSPGDGPQAWRLNGEAHRMSLVDGFDRLLAWPSLRGVGRYPHQERTCVRVLREMHGRAILADEVGLGKTVEAGLILKEYAIRGLVRRALILTPASLTGQWREEMESKFDLGFAVLRSVRDWEHRPLLIASIDKVKRGPHRAAAQQRPWDLVIVDEAHRLKNRLSVNWRFVASLSKKYMLLLTATPVQNDLDELFNLVSLLKPGALHTYDRFVERYVGSADGRVPAHVPELRDRLRDVMVRHRRGIAFTLPPRRVHSLPVRLSPAERRLPGRRVPRRPPARREGRRGARVPRGWADLPEHGGGWRGAEPAICADRGQLRPALEPSADRATDRARASSRAGPGGPRRESLGPGHGRGLSHGTFGPEDPHVRARRRRAGLDPGNLG